MSFSHSVARESVFGKASSTRLSVFIENLKPLNFLVKYLGKVIIVEYKGGNNVRGKLVRFDGHMNLLFADAVEITTWGEVISLGSVLLRGNNIVLILVNITEMVF